MASTKKEEEWRREGMAYAYRIAKVKGVEGLETEIKFRNINPDIPLKISQTSLDEFSWKVKENMCRSIIIVSLLTLHDEFGFGEKRLKQFMSRFNKKSSCLEETDKGYKYADWQDYIDILKDECNLDLSFVFEDTTTRVKD